MKRNVPNPGDSVVKGFEVGCKTGAVGFELDSEESLYVADQLSLKGILHVNDAWSEDQLAVTMGKSVSENIPIPDFRLRAIQSSPAEVVSVDG
jgi:hypothetical protein